MQVPGYYFQTSLDFQKEENCESRIIQWKVTAQFFLLHWLKTSENLQSFSCFQGFMKRNIEKEWVRTLIQWLTWNSKNIQDLTFKNTSYREKT